MGQPRWYGSGDHWIHLIGVMACSAGAREIGETCGSRLFFAREYGMEWLSAVRLAIRENGDWKWTMQC